MIFFFYFRLITTIDERERRVTEEISSLESVDKTALDLLDKLKRLQREINNANPWSKDQEETKAKFKVIQQRLASKLVNIRKVHEISATIT